MELIHGSETSAYYILTLGKYPKEHIQYSNHGGSLKSTINDPIYYKVTFFQINFLLIVIEFLHEITLQIINFSSCSFQGTILGSQDV